nr:MAG TPA: hypothetical protein [Caudoviricetes sp.]
MSEHEQNLAKYEFNEGVPEYSQEDYLRFAQSKRLSFMKAMEDAVGSPEGLATLDPDRQANYLRTIDAIEKQSLTLKKLKQEEQSNDAQNAAIAALILKSAKDRGKEIDRENTPIIPDPSVLPVKQLIAGETEIGDRTENFREYQIRTGQIDHQDQ